MAEWLKAAVSKTAIPGTVSWVRIPPPPPGVERILPQRQKALKNFKRKGFIMFNIRKKKDADLPQNNKELFEEFKRLKEENEIIKKEMRKMREREKESLRKVGIVRFNPFSDGGGNQSFSVAFLTEKGSGTVITSLYTKEGNRVYGKPVKDGRSEYSLSEEEKKAISKALGEN